MAKKNEKSLKRKKTNPKAPWGFKKDGTPKKKPGRKTEKQRASRKAKKRGK